MILNYYSSIKYKFHAESINTKKYNIDLGKNMKMQLRFLVTYSLILLVFINGSHHFLNFVYAQSNNISDARNIDTEVNDLLNKIGRGNIIDSTIDSLMQGMGSSLQPNSSPNTSLQPNSSPNTSLQPNSSPNTSLQPNSSPNTSLQPNSSPNTSLQPNSSPNTSLQPNSSPNTSLQPNSSPNTSLHPNSSPNTSPLPNTSSDLNNEIMSILKNQGSSSSTVTTSQTNSPAMKYFAKIVDKNSNNENIISSNSLTEFNNNLLKFCLDSGIDYSSCNSIIQDSLQAAEFTSSYMGPAKVNTDLIGYTLELKIR